MQRKILIAFLLAFVTASLFADKKASEHFTAVAVIPATSGPNTLELNINIEGYTDDATMAALGDILEGGLHLLGLGGREAGEALRGGCLRHAFPLSNQWLCAISCGTFEHAKQYLVPLLGKL